MPNSLANARAVHHQQATQTFYIDLGDEVQAYLRYTQDSDAGSVDFISTFVPDSHRGQGLAELLVDAGFAWAEQAGLTILTSCWYAELKYQRRGNAAATHADA